MALSTAVLIADTIYSAYLSRSLVDVSLEKSLEPSTAEYFSVSVIKSVVGVVNGRISM